MTASERACTLLRAIDAAGEGAWRSACIDRVTEENPDGDAVIGELIGLGWLKVTTGGSRFRVTSAGRREMLCIKAVT